MMTEKMIQLLDCTLRDGAYINGSDFGAPAMKGIIKNLQDAGTDIIECGWLKDDAYKEGSSYFHTPSDIEPYLLEKDDSVTYVTMIDWDRYDVDSNLPPYDGKTIDAIRVVFPRGKHRQGIEVGKKIRDKGYRVFFQAANTIAYSDEELYDLITYMNDFKPVSLSVVDTFGAMYEENVDRIVDVLCDRLDGSIRIGFHSHNNQQLSFALSAHFLKRMAEKERLCVVDASLCGMGRGAGNATTELVVSYLNRCHNGGYDLDSILDAIDKYMVEFQEKYKWGYSTEFFIAGLYQCHVNNIDYLLKNHRTNAQDMRNIIESLQPEERRKYDYDLLETRYLENQSRLIDDGETLKELSEELGACISSGTKRKVLLLCPGKSLIEKKADIDRFINSEHPIVIGVNAVIQGYMYDYIFFVNQARYEYTRESYKATFEQTKRIVLSNIHTDIKKKKDEKEINKDSDRTDTVDNERIVSYNHVIKRGWKYFDNPAICLLRLLDRLGMDEVFFAGFDGFGHKYNESYADPSLPSVNTDDEWDELNSEIKDMVCDFRLTARHMKEIHFITNSEFE